MKKLILIVAIAAMTIGVPSIASAQTQLGPRPGTVEAMQCLIRQGPEGCEKMFVGSAWVAAKSWVSANPNRDFNRGPLVSSVYWGRASETNVFDAKVLLKQPTNEMDIFDAKFAHTEYTLYISPVNGDGKINGLAIRLYGPHDLLQVSPGR